MKIRYRIAVQEDMDEICCLVSDAVETMIQNKIYQWDEIYPTEEDFREDIRLEQLYVGVAEEEPVANAICGLAGNMERGVGEDKNVYFCQGCNARNRIAVIYAINKECDVQYIKGKWQNPTEPFYIVHRLCVNPVFQNQGIAAITLRHIEEQLTAWGIHAVRLDVFSENTYALKTYAKMGYQKVGEADFRKGRFYLMEKYF